MFCIDQVKQMLAAEPRVLVHMHQWFSLFAVSAILRKFFHLKGFRLCFST